MLDMLGMRFLVLVVVACLHIARAAADPAIALDGYELGRRFDGIGGLSGGGATSRFLPSYKKPYVDEIFDYLFLPYFGASLQICKVEIGGDCQTTEGTESSHMHSRDDLNFERGYEWWIMSEAKKRNPDVLLYGLSWCAPGWIGNRSFFSQDNIDYHVKWVQGAKSQYNLDIDFIGVWNERAWDADWIIQFRNALDVAGFRNTKIVAADAGWDIADTMVVNATLKQAVGVVGAHYPGTYSSTNATRLENPLWASEDYSTYADSTGGGCWGRILNQNYVNGYITATISWNLIAAYYDNLPFPGDGLMWGSNPWSGHYEVTSPIWITAHTTQFTKPGWHYLAHGSGVGHLPKGGSYVTLVPNDNSKDSDFSLIIETFSRDNSVCIRPYLAPFTVTPQNVTFALYNLAITKPLYVWRSHLTPTKNNSLFELVDTIRLTDNKLTLNLDVDSIWTISTLTGQKKGMHPTPPAATLFPLDYSDNFDSYAYNQEADFFIDQTGTFEIYKGNTSRVMRQVVLEPPIQWCGESNGPISLIGEYTAADQNLTVDALIEAAGGSLSVGVRVQSGGCGNSNNAGYFFAVDPQGKWNINAGQTVIESGTLASPFGTDTWHTINFWTEGSVVCATVDGVAAGCAKDNQYHGGFASIGSSWNNVQFDNFKLVSTTSDCGQGNYIKIDTCLTALYNSQWQIRDDGTVRLSANPDLCLDIYGVNDFTQLPAARLRSCDSNVTTQQWKYSGSTLLTNDGKCLDIVQRSTVPCSNIQVYNCTGGDNQIWSYDKGQLRSGAAPNMCLSATA